MIHLSMFAHTSDAETGPISSDRAQTARALPQAVDTFVVNDLVALRARA